MSRIQVSTDRAPAPGGAYSQAIVAGGFLYTAGLGPHDPDTGQLAGDAIESQTTQVMRNLAAVLAARNLDFSHVIKATVHLQDLHRDFAGFNSAYEKFVIAPYPVRTTVGSVLAGILVEIDVVALCA
jgi:2-iminobutanoate/2-iminopropanoate deaminase